MPDSIKKKWIFKSRQIVKEFDQHIKSSIPNYTYINDIISHSSTFFVNDNSIVYDLGSSIGNLLKKNNNYNQIKLFLENCNFNLIKDYLADKEKYNYTHNLVFKKNV